MISDDGWDMEKSAGGAPYGGHADGRGMLRATALASQWGDGHIRVTLSCVCGIRMVDFPD
jgi:hypothetical protein